MALCRPEEWPQFISCFNTITEAYGFSNLENFKRLQDSLFGDALEQVRGVLLLPETVPSVIEDLKNLVGRPQTLLKCLLKKARGAKAPTEEDLSTFISFGLKVKQLRDHLVANENVAKLLNADGSNEPLTVTWTSNISRTEDRSKTFGYLDRTRQSDGNCLMFVLCRLPSQCLHLAHVVRRYKHLSDIPVSDEVQHAPQMIIGLNNIELFAALEIRVGKAGEPVAVRYKLGWTVYGVDNGATTSHVVINVHCITAMTNRELHDAVRSQYQLEQLYQPAFDTP
uniref:Uncharacterized protein n=1 Tax=Anopheles epiroticus TaxID=199890 RepID=A0A182PWJ2_9DIPT